MTQEQHDNLRKFMSGLLDLMVENKIEYIGGSVDMDKLDDDADIFFSVGFSSEYEPGEPARIWTGGTCVYTCDLEDWIDGHPPYPDATTISNTMKPVIRVTYSNEGVADYAVKFVPEEWHQGLGPHDELVPFSCGSNEQLWDVDEAEWSDTVQSLWSQKKGA